MFSLIILLYLFPIVYLISSCEENLMVEANESAFLLIAVMSAPGNVERRRALRNSWFNTLPPGVEARFFVGQTGESAERIADHVDLHESDVVRLDLVESYGRLASKTRAVLGAAVGQFASAQFVFKTDDDVYLRPDLLLNITLQLADQSSKPIYMGHFHVNAFVVRAPNAKFYEPGQHDCKHHLPYASGAGYLLSRSLALYLAQPPLPLRQFRLEDVAVGAWLSPLDIRRINVKFLIRPERDPNLLPANSFCPEHSAPLPSRLEGSGQQQPVELLANCPEDAFFLQHRLTPTEIETCFRNRHDALKAK